MRGRPVPCVSLKEDFLTNGWDVEIRFTDCSDDPWQERACTLKVMPGLSFKTVQRRNVAGMSFLRTGVVTSFLEQLVRRGAYLPLKITDGNCRPMRQRCDGSVPPTPRNRVRAPSC